ncbi:DUF4139 domain-containing protein [Sulfurovum sp. CS9]|uniref:DUF4139 domain-containing protein n=1 Tax=Sulfurovum sp. CS9 TaxID=3391146 RepID=UPI0039EB472E
MQAFTFTKSLTLGLLLSSGLSQASSLAIYQDSATYTFQPETSFIGFAKGLEAKCKGNVILLKASSACPSDDRLCQELTEIKGTVQKLKATQANIKVLNTLVSLPQPTSFDAASWIESAKIIGTEQARLSVETTILTEELALLSKDFERQAPTPNALSSRQSCPEELELTLPYGQLSFSSFYEADIADKKSVTVTQYLSITNKSGIDMQADDAMFFYRPAHRYIRPIHFSPWIVSKYIPRPKRSYAKAKRAAAMDEEQMVGTMSMIATEAPAPVAQYLNAREYQIKDLSLPSTGMPLDVQVTQWKVPLQCDIRVFPYKNTTAFHTCSFTPKLQIDNNQWKVRSAQTTINDKAVGEYREGKYRLYTQAELDIKVERKPIVKREKTTGIFGGTARKKDGFTVKVTNKSDTPKTLTITERIPTSTTEEIKVKLLEVRSDKKVNYKLLKDGEIEMNITLAAYENKNIEVLFEISYDKDLKVSY